MKIHPGSDIKYTKLKMYCMKNVIYFTFSIHPLELLFLHFLLNPVHLFSIIQTAVVMHSIHLVDLLHTICCSQ